MTTLLHDLRYAVRMLVKDPVFTAAAVLTLALGIGLNAATFSAVSGILFRPLDGVREPDELVQLYRNWPGIEYGSNSIPHYQDIRDRTGDVFESVAAYYFAPLSLASGGQSERIIGMVVSANFFQTYGVVPARGRFFLPDEEARGPGAHPVAVLGHGFWQARFGGDEGIVGRTVNLNGSPYEVVGIAPPDFKGPVNFASIPLYVPLMQADALEPLRGFDRITSRGNNNMNVVARLRDGQTVERARLAMERVLTELREEYPDFYRGQLGTTLVLQSEAGIHPMFRSAQLGMSTVMMVVVSLLLLIACVNVANLFLARARERRREMGVRLSLGAGRGLIVRQLLTESVVFSAVAGAAGLGLAFLALRVIGGIRPPVDGPWDFQVEMDTTVLLFTAGVSLAAGFLFGMAPALQAVRPDTIAAVKGEGGDGGGRSRASSALVVAQMALSVLLLIGSGLFLRGLEAATRIDPGFDDPSSLVLVSFDPGLQGYDLARTREFFDRVLEEARALPDVTAAAYTDTPPLGLDSSDRGISIPGYEFAEGERRSILYANVGEGYFEAMGIDLVEGRTFTHADDDSGPPVIIVNRHFAERFWPGQSALGRIVQTAGAEREVVGVVETGRYRSLGEDPQDFMYFPLRERFSTAVTLVARTPRDPGAALSRIRGIVRSADPDMPLYNVRTMEDHMGLALLPARLGGTVLGLFGLLGLVLAAVGIYGVMAYSVAQRTRELGIRVALGADRSSVVGMVLGEGMKLTAIGAVLGLGAAAWAARLVAGLLYGVNPFDPAAFGGVTLILLMVAAVAVYLPARRAASVDPMRALKVD